MKELINKAIFQTTDKSEDLIYKLCQGNDCYIISEKKLPELYLNNNDYILFNKLKSNFSNVLSAMKNKLIIIYGVNYLYKYDTPIARFMVNVARKETDKKIVFGEKMINKHNYDIFSYMFFIDQKILNINHYWCFKANHYEMSVFDREPIKMLDTKYLAMKLKNHVIINKEPESELENEIILAKKCI
jgi:hypothetical protein